MRTATVGELAVLASTQYQVWQRVLITDGDGTYRDYADQFGHNFIESIDITADIDQPAAQATIHLRRDVDDATYTLSLSPFREDSDMNRNAVLAYSPAVDIGRAVQIFVATMAVGATPGTSDWKNVFEGMIDDLDAATSTLVLTARDAAGALQDRFVETETAYGAVDGSVELEDVIQLINDTWAGGVTLVTPSSPGFAIKPYKQSRVPVLEANQTLAGLIGWSTRFWWNESGSAWQYQLRDPDRTKTIPDRSIAASRYLSVQKLSIARTDVRNVIWVWYTDAATGVRTFVESKDDDSIARFERQWMEVDLASDSPIDSAAEAQIFADGMRDDLKDPKADQVIEMHIDWTVELGDLFRFLANGIHYSVDQDWAVVSYRHTLSATQQRTTVAVRGKPAGRYLGWIALSNSPVTDPASSGPSLIVNAVVTASDVSIDVRHTGALTLSIDGGLTFADPAVTPGITAYPYTVARPDGAAGLPALRYVFKASLNNQEVSHPVDIPPTDVSSGVKPPPDGTYGTVAPGTTVVPIHAAYADRMVLAAMSASRVELDDGTRFRLDATPYATVRLVAQVMTVGATGAVLALEYFDAGSSTWLPVSGTDCTVPIDALGTQAGAYVTLLAAVTGDLVFRVVTDNGDGATSPVLGNVSVQFVIADPATVARAGILYLRELLPSSSPDASEFPFAAAFPAHSYMTGSNNTSSAGVVRALRSSKGSDITGRHVEFGATDTNHPRDLFPGAYLSEPFTAGQSVAAGLWELVTVAQKFASHDYAIPKVVIYLLRNVAGTWTNVATIYDTHDTSGDGINLTYLQSRVSRKTVMGASFDAQAGDVLAVEPWYHYDRMAGYATGHAVAGVDDGLARLYYDGADDIPLAAADGGAWTASYPASYIKPPISLAVGVDPPNELLIDMSTFTTSSFQAAVSGGTLSEADGSLSSGYSSLTIDTTVQDGGNDTLKITGTDNLTFIVLKTAFITPRVWVKWRCKLSALFWNGMTVTDGYLLFSRLSFGLTNSAVGGIVFNGTSDARLYTPGIASTAFSPTASASADTTLAGLIGGFHDVVSLLELETSTQIRVRTWLDGTPGQDATASLSLAYGATGFENYVLAPRWQRSSGGSQDLTATDYINIARLHIVDANGIADPWGLL